MEQGSLGGGGYNANNRSNNLSLIPLKTFWLNLTLDIDELVEPVTGIEHRNICPNLSIIIKN